MNEITADPIRGLIAPLLTPYNDDLSIAHDLYVDHATKMLREGCVGLTPFGTTGEAASISGSERMTALWHLTQGGIHAADMIPGTGLTDFRATAELSRSCMDMGCAAVMILPPYYYKKVSDDGLFDYYKRVIELVGDDVRIWLYNIPHVAGVGLSISLVRRLREHFPEQIVAIKDSSGDIENAKALLRIDGLSVFLGSEVVFSHTVDAGARGTITAVANLNAMPVAEFTSSVINGERVSVEYARGAINAARDAIVARDFIATPKRVLAIRTGDDRWANVRPPLVPAPLTAGQALENELRAID